MRNKLEKGLLGTDFELVELMTRFHEVKEATFLLKSDSRDNVFMYEKSPNVFRL